MNVLTGLTFEEYEDIEAVSHSDLKAWARGESRSTRKTLVGTAVHDVVLRPDHAKDTYVTMDQDVDLRKTEGKAVYAQWTKDNPGKTILRPAERETVRQCVKTLKSHADAWKIICAPGDNEVCYVGTLPGRQLQSKGLLDMVRRGCLGDLKTTGYANQDEFLQQIVKYGYASGAAYYLDLYAAHTNRYVPMLNVCVSTRTSEVWIHRFTPEQMAFGRQWYEDVFTLMERDHGNEDLRDVENTPV